MGGEDGFDGGDVARLSSLFKAARALEQGKEETEREQISHSSLYMVCRKSPRRGSCCIAWGAWGSAILT